MAEIQIDLKLIVNVPEKGIKINNLLYQLKKFMAQVFFGILRALFSAVEEEAIAKLKKTFPKLVKSYALDAIDADGGKRKFVSSPQKASCFIDDIRSCLVKGRSSISLGTDLRLVSQKVIGSAMSVENEIIHLTAFSRDDKNSKKKVPFYQRASRRKR